MEDINPFSTRFLRPGANPYLFEELAATDETLEERSRTRCHALIDVLLGKKPPIATSALANEHRQNASAACNSMRWSIVGPHGTGKSTLACCLIELLQQREVPVECVRLSTAQRRLGKEWRRQANAKGGVFVVDGYEQLSLLGKLHVILYSQWLRQRLLITAHQKMRGFQVLYETKRTARTEELVVSKLLQNSPVSAAELLASPFWRTSQIQQGQNLRESLFDAYDWYEQQIR